MRALDAGDAGSSGMTDFAHHGVARILKGGAQNVNFSAGRRAK
jgi:hypothetical protein